MPTRTDEIAFELQRPSLPVLLQKFLRHLEHGDSDSQMDLRAYAPPARLTVFPSVRVHFYAPNEQSGTSGMRRERIRAVTSWRKGPPRYDCAFVAKNGDVAGFQGLDVVRVRTFFSFRGEVGEQFDCALVSWFVPVGEQPCQVTGMWIVEPLLDDDGEDVTSIIRIDRIVRAAYLQPYPGDENTPIPNDMSPDNTLDSFTAFYVNKYIDYSAHGIAY